MTNLGVFAPAPPTRMNRYPKPPLSITLPSTLLVSLTWTFQTTQTKGGPVVLFPHKFMLKVFHCCSGPGQMPCASSCHSDMLFSTLCGRKIALITGYKKIFVLNERREPFPSFHSRPVISPTVLMLLKLYILFSYLFAKLFSFSASLLMLSHWEVALEAPTAPLPTMFSSSPLWDKSP